MKSPWARPLGILFLLLATHAAIGAIMLLNELMRMIPEQLFMLILAKGLGRDPDVPLLLLHAIAMAALAGTLQMWQNEHPRTRLAMAITAALHGLLAPYGLLVTAALVWMLRHPDIDVHTPIAPVAGGTRTAIVLIWGAASLATWSIAFGAFILADMNPLLWFPVMIATPLPQAAIGYWLMRRPERADAINVMPELPQLRGRQA